MSAVFPVQPAEPHRSPSTSPAGPAAGAGPVLLVEDDAINRMVAQAFLQSLGDHTVHVAANGAEALDLCARHAYALVLMDCVMPVMGGLEATRRLRAAGHRMPVIALTGSTDAQDVARCLEAGMDDHLAKPVDVQRLARTLAHWLPGPQAGSAALN